MVIEIFTLCDAATVNAGKLNILGTFDRITGQSVPLNHPSCAVALQLRFEAGEEGPHEIELHLIDADGQQIVPPMEATTHADLKDGQWSLNHVIINLHGLPFRSFGQCDLQLWIDGQFQRSLPIAVLKRS